MNNEELKKQIIAGLDLPGLTQVQQEEIVSLLTDNVYKKINIAILDRLPEGQKESFANIRKEEILTYLSGKIDDLPLLTERIAKETIDEFVKTRGNL